MLGTGGAASSSSGQVVSTSTSVGEPPGDNVVLAALQLMDQIGIQEPPPPDDEHGQEHASAAPPMHRRPVLQDSDVVPQRDCVKLRSSFCKDGACQVLEHEITGEVVQCLSSESWRLHFANSSGLGYIVSGSQKMWVNHLLTCSVHKCTHTGDEFIVQRVSVSPLEHKQNMFWLAEWQLKHDARWISWDASPGVPKLPVAKVERHHGQPGEPKMFWTILDWFHAAGCSTAKTTCSKQLQYFKRRFHKNFPELDLELHLGESDAMCPDSRYRSRQPRASTLVLFLMLLDWAMLTDNNVEPLQPLRLIVGLSKLLVHHCDLKLSCLISPEDPQAWQEPAALVMGDKVIWIAPPNADAILGAEVNLPEMLAEAWVKQPNLAFHFLVELAAIFDDALPAAWAESCKSFCLPSLPAGHHPRLHLIWM